MLGFLGEGGECLAYACFPPSVVVWFGFVLFGILTAQGGSCGLTLKLSMRCPCDQLEVDTEFLAGRQIMDYSLLMGFSEVLPGEKTFEDLYGEQERNAPWIFGYQMDSNQKVRVFRISLGIIDILQGFTMKKRAEFLSKTMRYCATNQVRSNP